MSRRSLLTTASGTEIELDQRLVVLDEIRRRFPHVERAGSARTISSTWACWARSARRRSPATSPSRWRRTACPTPSCRAQSAVLHLRRRRRLAARHRRPGGRHVRDGFLRLSRLPRQHHQGAAGRAQPRHGPQLRAAHAADVARQGGDLVAGAASWAARRWSTSSSSTPTPAIKASAGRARHGATAAASAPPAPCASGATSRGARAGRSSSGLPASARWRTPGTPSTWAASSARSGAAGRWRRSARRRRTGRPPRSGWRAGRWQ